MIFKKFLTILILLPTVLLISQPVQAECSDINFSSFAANPRSVTNARPQSEFMVRMTTTCPPADQDFNIFFNTDLAPGSPGPRLHESQLTSAHFTRSANGQFYEGVYQADVQPFDQLSSTTHTVTYWPLLWDRSQNRLVATAPSSMRQTMTRSDAAGTPTPTPIQTPTPTPSGGGTIDVPQIENPTKATDLSVLISRVIRILLSLIAMASAIMIIVSGFRMVAHGGNPATLESAKKGMIWAILGLVVAIMSFSIISIIQRLAS